MADKPGMKRVQIDLPVETHQAFKVCCALEGTTMSNVIGEAIEQWLKEHHRPWMEKHKS